MTKIFISHAKEDNSVVIRILTLLDNAGIPKWVDIEQLEELDANVNEEINEGIATSDHFLLVWSEFARASKYVKKEYNAATSHGYDERLKKIIIKLDDTLLPPLLADKKYHTVEKDQVDEVIEKIIKKIKQSEENRKQREFDNFLDATYGNVKIVNDEYSTSLAFKRINSKKYQQEFDGWIQNG